MNAPRITVHHVRETNVMADLHLYCGRPGSCKRSDLIDAKLGNPHWMKNESQRDKVCDAYRKTLLDMPDHPHWKPIKRIAERFAEGQSIALYCFCAPKRCHCDEIMAAATILAEAIINNSETNPETHDT